MLGDDIVPLGIKGLTPINSGGAMYFSSNNANPINGVINLNYVFNPLSVLSENNYCSSVV